MRAQLHGEILLSLNHLCLQKWAGTHFWHSHSLYQRGDGAFGAYVVRQDFDTDPHSNLYDVDMTDHVIFTQEYFHAVSNF